MARKLVLAAGLAGLLLACNGDPTQPESVVPSTEILPMPAASEPAAAPVTTAPPAVTLAACTHHWASGASGSWFTAASWSPATVPGAASTACIDGAGTYTVTLDPANDATPVVIDGLALGGASGAQTLHIAGTAAILTIATGVDVKSSGVLSLAGANGIVLTAGGIANAGTLKTLPTCGGCGHATIRSDLDNAGLLQTSGNGLILDKINGVYRNTGTIDVMGTLTIPASTGNPSFTLAGGSITSTALNPGLADFRMRAGTFTYTGGGALSTSRGLVTIEGGNLVFGPSAAGTAAFSMLPAATGNSFTGNIGPNQRVRMPLVGGTQTMTSRTLTLVGDVVNEGTLEIQQSPSSGFPILAGTGTLTNKGTLISTGTGGDSMRIAINLQNEGTITSNGRFLHFDQPALTYTNAGTINGNGTLRARGVTLTNESGAHLNIATELNNEAHLLGTGTNTTSLRVFGGSTVSPGQSPGILTVGSLQSINGGILDIELGGLEAGTGYDQIQSVGQSTLSGGTLRITTVNGFVAGKCGQVFDIITHNSPGGIGVFPTIEGLDQGSNRQLKVLYAKPIVRLVGLDAGKLVGTTTEPVPATEGGATGSYAVCLGERPNASVTITPSPNAQVTVSPSSLTFTPSDWELPKIITITAVDDQVTEGTHTGRITQAVTSTDSRFNNFVLAAITATITDNDTNRNPTPGHDNASTSQGTPVEIDVLANDSDPDGDALTITAVTTQASGVATIINGGTRVRFAPATGFSGSANFGYTVGDGHGGSATGGVTVAVAAPPTTDITWTTAEDTPFEGPPLAFGGGGCPTVAQMRITSVTQPANGRVSIVRRPLGGCGQYPWYVRFVPNANFAGTTNFTAIGWSGGPAPVTVRITMIVTPVNDKPVAVNDAATATAGAAPVRIEVLTNDSDTDGDALSVTGVTRPVTGTATISSDGKAVLYSAPPRFVGSSQFRYTVSDGQGGTARGIVDITVPQAADLAIAATADPHTAFFNDRITYDWSVSNLGPSASAGSTVTITWSAIDGVGALVRIPDNCTQTGAVSVRCSLSPLGPGKSRGFRTVWKTGIIIGNLVATFTVSSAGDPDSANDSVTLSNFWPGG